MNRTQDIRRILTLSVLMALATPFMAPALAATDGIEPNLALVPVAIQELDGGQAWRLWSQKAEDEWVADKVLDLIEMR